MNGEVRFGHKAGGVKTLMADGAQVKYSNFAFVVSACFQ